jgi:hypothetical protein
MVRPFVEVGQHQRGDGLGNGGRRVSEADADLAVFLKDVVGSRPDDAGERLCVEENEHGGDPSRRGTLSPFMACRSSARRWCWAIGAGSLVERCGTVALGMSSRPIRTGCGKR